MDNLTRVGEDVCGHDVGTSKLITSSDGSVV